MNLNTKAIFKKILSIFLAFVFIFLSFPFSVSAFFHQNSTPNLNISFSFDGQNILDKGIYEVSLNKQKQNIFVYSRNLSGDVYAEIYKGELNNSQLIFSLKTDNSGILKSQNTFSSEGKYFAVLYQITQDCGVFTDFCLDNTTQEGVRTWLQSGFLAGPIMPQIPKNWGMISFQVKATKETGYSNIAFFPGIQASRLYTEESNSENRLWEPNWYKDVESLYLDEKGESINDIYTNEIIDEAFGFNIYKKFSAFLDELSDPQTGVINKWQAFVYDWRMGLDEILENDVKLKNKESYNIIDALNKLADDAQNKKVTIIAHSNGGLLAKMLIYKLKEENSPILQKIDKIILVATPQLGTPKALMSLLHGGEQGLTKGWLPNHKDTRELAENMKSAYSLLPSEKYFELVDAEAQPIIEFEENSFLSRYFTDIYGKSIKSFLDLENFLLGENTRKEPAPENIDSPNVLDASFLEKAKETHTKLDDLVFPENIKVVEIAGWGLETIRGISYKERRKYLCGTKAAVYSCRSFRALTPDPLFTKDGDKTVVAPSAISADKEKYYLNLFSNNEELIFNTRRNRDHADILEVSSIQDLIKSIILNTKDDTKLPKNISSTKPPTDEISFRLAMHSPVAVHIYDSKGRHTGPAANPDPNSDIKLYEEQIPNSYYFKLGEAKYAGVSGGEDYRVELLGLDTGTFTFELEKLKGNDLISKKVFKDIPTSKNMKADISLSPFKESDLSLDVDGDGKNDLSLSGDKKKDLHASFFILKNIVSETDMHKKLKRKLLRSLEKAKKELKEGKIKKAKRDLKNIEKILKHQIRKNNHLDKKNKRCELKQEKKEAREKKREEKEKKHKNKNRKEHKWHKENKNKCERFEKRKKIDSKDAWKLINIIESIKINLKNYDL